MTLPPQIIVVGSHAPGLFIRVKRTPQAGETVIGWDFQEPVDGGKGSNQAIAAARLGASVSFVGCVGKDRIGDQGKQWMQEAGVDTSLLLRSEQMPSGVGFIMLDERGVPAMVTSLGANAGLNKADVSAAIDQFSGARVLLTQFEIPPEVALHAAELSQQRRMISIVNPAPAVSDPGISFKVADVLVPNESEAKILLGLDPHSNLKATDLAIELFKSSRAGSVIITLGEKGIVGFDPTGLWESLPPQVEVVDTSGAGDVFCAALAVGLTQAMSIRTASVWACKVAAFSVSRPGTIPSFPTIKEIKGVFG